MIAGVLTVLQTLNQIFTAAIAITSFSLLLYSLAFNLRNRVARTFALVLTCVTIVYTAEAFGSVANSDWAIGFWLRVEWIGIVWLPATYFHFSDSLLATTGKPSIWRRYWMVRASYFISLIFLFTLLFSSLVGPVIIEGEPAPHLQPTYLTKLFLLYYAAMVIMAWYNFVRAYKRTTTSTSRRRMIYLIIGALSPAIGSIPYLLFGSSFAARHSLIFWTTALIGSFVLGTLIVLMAYSVAFFGVSWPDRVIKSRLLKWLLRGPVTASLALGITTIVRRLGDQIGIPYTAFVPISMILTILLLEYSITLFSPYLERWFFQRNDQSEIEALQILESRLLTKNDLRQFLESVLAAICDQLQATGAYIAVLVNNQVEFIVHVGQMIEEHNQDITKLQQLFTENPDLPPLLAWESERMIPLFENTNGERRLLGIIGILGINGQTFDAEQTSSLNILVDRTILALKDHYQQQKLFSSLQELSPQFDMIQRLRAASQFDRSSILASDIPQPTPDMIQWVRDGLTHYWGGPKLTQNPLMQLQIVQQELKEDKNDTNALRSVLRKAIQQIRPEGEQRFTADWMLYNILEMKFIQGKKVREIAMRLAVSEADLYRKQRIAIESVAKTIMEMENNAKKNGLKL